MSLRKIKNNFILIIILIAFSGNYSLPMQQEGASKRGPRVNLGDEIGSWLNARDTLGGDYKFVTQLGTDGDIDQNKIVGNLYLIGSSDPSLRSEDIEELIIALKQDCVTEITGNFYIDLNRFDHKCFAPGTKIAESQKPDNAFFELITFWMQLFEQYNIKVNGEIEIKKLELDGYKIKSGEKNWDINILAKHESESLDEIINNADKNSEILL